MTKKGTYREALLRAFPEARVDEYGYPLACLRELIECDCALEDFLNSPACDEALSENICHACWERERQTIERRGLN